VITLLKRIGAKKLAALLLFLVMAGAAGCAAYPGDETGATAEPGQEHESKETQSPDRGLENDLKLLEGYYYLQLNEPIVDFELESLDGGTVRLSDLKGQVVILNFWATWCPPCREEMPHFQEFYEKYKDKGVTVLAVNPNIVENNGFNDSEGAKRKARSFIEQEGYTFPVLVDADNSAWYVYQQRGIPANYVIDANGMIRFLKPGAFISLEEIVAFAKAAGAGID